MLRTFNKATGRYEADKPKVAQPSAYAKLLEEHTKLQHKLSLISNAKTITTVRKILLAN